MPSLPEPPDDQSENRAWIDEQAERVAVLARTQLRKIVLRAYDAYLSTLTAAGDLAAFDSIPQEWGVFVGEQLLDEIDGVYRSGAVAAWNQAPTTAALGESAALAWAAVVNEDAVSYAAQASNRLAGVGHDIWMKVNSEVTEAIRQGTGTEALKNEIERLTGFSEFRADTIARTEIGSAFVNGNYEAQKALGEYGAVFKEWLSVADARTRPEHAALNGTVIPFDDMFDAGGEMMRAPHDETASAANVVNCRCDVLFYYPGDTLPDGTLVQAPGAEPDSEQGTAGPEVAEELATTVEQRLFDIADRPFDEQVAAGAEELAKLYSKALPAEFEPFIRDYGGGGFQPMNAYLRGNDPLVSMSGWTMDQAAESVSQLRRAFESDAAHVLERDLVVHRSAGIEALGGSLPDVGTILSDPAFVSTSARPYKPQPYTPGGFSRSVRMRILVEKGTRVLGPSEDEFEMLLAPGQQFRVIRISDDGYVDMVIE